MKLHLPCAAPRWISLLLLLLPGIGRAQNLNGQLKSDSVVTTPEARVLTLSGNGNYLELPSETVPRPERGDLRVLGQMGIVQPQ